MKENGTRQIFNLISGGSKKLSWYETTQTLIILSGGRFEDKIEAFFLLYDIAYTKTLMLEELTNIMSSTFKVFLKLLSSVKSDFMSFDY